MPLPEVAVLKESTEELPHRSLLIAAAFPPSSVVGALRWQKFVGILHDSQIAFDVVTMHPDEAESVDMSRMTDLPKSTRVLAIRAARLQPFRLVFDTHRRFSDRKRSGGGSQASVPSVRQEAASVSTPALIRTTEIRRVPRSLRDLRRIYRGWLDREAEREWPTAVLAASPSFSSGYDAVISSGPPNLAHVTAAKIASAITRPFVMDMRDPWGTAVAYPSEAASPFEVRYARQMEAYCASRAAAVLVNTPLARELFVNAHPNAAGRCHVVMNGTDDDVRITEAAPRTRFTIVFAGSIYIDRNPRLVLRAAASVIRNLGVAPSEFGLQFIGSVFEFGGTSTMRIAEEEGVADFVELLPFMPRKQLLERLTSAAMLLSLPQDVETSIPAKIFEYMAFPAWLLVLAPEHSATYSLLQNSGADVLRPTDVAGIEACIHRRFLEFRAGKLPEPIGASGAFSRTREAAKLQHVLSELMDG